MTPTLANWFKPLGCAAGSSQTTVWITGLSQQSSLRGNWGEEEMTTLAVDSTRQQMVTAALVETAAKAVAR
jgi:hypothetical protein